MASCWVGSRKFVVGYKWFYDIKTQFDSTIDIYKACLMAQDFTQKYGTYCEETFASITQLTCAYSLIVITAICH